MIKTNKTITLENVLDNTKKRQNLIYKDLTKKKKVGYFLLKKNLNDLNKTIENNLTKNRSVFYYELNNGDQKEKTEFELDVDIKDYTINVMLSGLKLELRLLNKPPKTKLKEGLTYKELYYFSDMSLNEERQLKVKYKNPIFLFIYTFIYSLKKTFYTKSFIEKMKNITEKMKSYINGDEVQEEKLEILHANDYIFNSKLVHERYCSLLKEHYMTSDVLNKKDLRKIYKKILSEDLYGIGVSKG